MAALREYSMPGKDASDDDDDDAEDDPPSDDDVEDGPDTYEVTMEESVYSDIVISTLRMQKRKLSKLSWVESVIVFLGLAFVEVILVCYLLPAIAPDFDEDGIVKKSKFDIGGGVNLFEQWKIGDGQEHQHNDTWAHYACSGEDWSYFSQQLDDMKEYGATSPLSSRWSSGALFGVTALVLWSLLITKEFRSIAEYLALLTLQPGEAIHTYTWSKENGIELHSLTIAAKCIVATVASFRFCMNVLLGWKGALFLSFTTNLKDFVLNSVALGFIYDLDELVFAVALDSKKQQVVKVMQPLILKEEGVTRLLACALRRITTLAIVMGGSLVMVTYHYSLMPWSQEYLCKAYAKVCPDDIPSFCSQ